MDLLPDLWSQDYWLPPGVTWTDMERLADSERPQPRDLLLTVPLALAFVTLRCVFERYSTPVTCLLVNIASTKRAASTPHPNL